MLTAWLRLCRQLGAETEAALAVVLDTAARPDAYRARPHSSPERNGCSGSGSGRSSAGGAVYSYEDQISGLGPHAAGVTLEEANTVAAQAAVQVRSYLKRYIRICKLCSIVCLYI